MKWPSLLRGFCWGNTRSLSRIIWSHDTQNLELVINTQLLDRSVSRSDLQCNLRRGHLPIATFLLHIHLSVKSNSRMYVSYNIDSNLINWFRVVCVLSQGFPRRVHWMSLGVLSERVTSRRRVIAVCAADS